MKVSVKTAKSELNQFIFEYAHGTTSQFFETGIADIMEVRKGSKMEVQLAALRRIDPMVLPPMSSVSFNTRFFYVPMIDICPYYNDLDARTPYAFRYGQASSQLSSTIPQEVQKIQTKDIKLLFLNDLQESIIGEAGAYRQNWEVDYNDYVTLVATKETYTGQAYDFRIGVVNNPNLNEPTYDGYAFFKFTHRGRRAYKLFKQLGYDFAITKKDKFKTTYQYNTAQSDTFSALPLLAFVKVYLNFYESAQYVNNTDRLSRLNSLLHCDMPAYVLSEMDLDLIVDLACYITYDLDYFTSSFVNPANGNNFIENNENISMQDITYTDNSINNGPNGTAVVENVNDDVVISQNALNMLKRLNAYLRRHQIAGGRMVDRELVEYGISIDDSYSRRCSYIDSITSVMNVSPVMNTTSDKLGEYAGFGSAANDMKNNTININIPDQDGYIVVVDTSCPEIFYSQGYRRQNRHITKWDFVAGTDFDAVGTQAIEMGEILMTKEYEDYHNSENPTALSFGFVPRGAEYKQRVSQLTGDFICNSVNTDIESYFTNREFREKDFKDTNNKILITTSQAFVSTYDSAQFARIFYDNKNKTDYIKTIFRFRVKLTAPYKEIYDEYKLEDMEGNNEVKMNVGGRQFN